MTRQTINFLGGVVVTAIVVLGLFLGVLPRWQQAGAAENERRVVALQNQGQQALIAALAAQRRQLPQLQAQVAALKQQIASGPHLEQLIEVAAALPAGSALRSITPAPGTARPAAAGFRSLPVTIVIDLRQADAAAKTLDGLRAGPRLLAIDQATLASGGSGKATKYTLTVDGRVFMNQAAAR
jgi:Tfp pilus assembly protein PilO